MNISDFSSKYRTVIILVGIFLFFDVIAPLLLNLLGIDIQYFMVYLLWINVMALCFIFLPSNVGDIFET